MGIKADLKAARVQMQAGDPAQALAIIQSVLDGPSPELQDPQLKYAFLITAGLAHLAAENLSASEGRFREAAGSLPDAPQAWKGLIECLERGGRVEALPECLERAAEIAEGKGNLSRARSLRLRLGQVLDDLGRPEEALEALLMHVNNPDAIAGEAGGSSGIAGEERLSMLLLVAVLEVAKEDIAVTRRVEKRLEKSSFGVGLSTSAAASAASVAAPAVARSRDRSALLSEYRGKVLAKDAAEGSPVAERLNAALRALEAFQGSAPDPTDLTDPIGVTDATGATGGLTGRNAAHAQAANTLKAVVVRFCRAFLGRAVQIAESSQRGDGGSTTEARAVAGTGVAVPWQGVIDAGVSVRKAVGGAEGDGGWVAMSTLLASSYTHVDGVELWRMAQEGSEDAQHPWLSAEACLHLAGVALWAGDALEADKLLQAAATAAAAATAVASPAVAAPAQAVSATTAGRTQRSTRANTWNGLSGPGSDWRELSLRCLVDKKLGYPGAARGDPKTALARAEEAVMAFEDSRLIRGTPGGHYGDLLGRLTLARASLLLKMGRLDEARLAADNAAGGGCSARSSGKGDSPVDEADSPTDRADTSAESYDGPAEEDGGSQAEAQVPGMSAAITPQVGDDGSTVPYLYCSAKCVAADVDMAEGDFDAAKAKLEDVLDRHAGFADALSRLGWLLLGCGHGVGVGIKGGVDRGDVEAARSLLERAVGEEPNSSSHAFRLAR